MNLGERLRELRKKTICHKMHWQNDCPYHDRPFHVGRIICQHPIYKRLSISASSMAFLWMLSLMISSSIILERNQPKISY